MEYGPPPLFNQGVSARARLAFFAFLAVVLIVVDARVKALESVRAGVGAVLYPLQQLMLLPGHATSKVSEYFTSVSQLQKENERLKRAQLTQSLALQQFEQLYTENETLRKLGALAEQVATPSVITEVRYEAQDRFVDKLIINKGAQQGIKAGQPVVDALGVVGQVTRVFAKTSEVTLITDKDQSLSVQVLRNGLRSVVFGDPLSSSIDLRFMAANADILAGDTLVTSGLDGVYPPGLPVGTVTQVERSAKNQFARISAEPIAGIHHNRFLLVLQVDPQAALIPASVAAEGNAQKAAPATKHNADTKPNRKR